MRGNTNFDNKIKFAQGTCINMSKNVVKFLLHNYNNHLEFINKYDDDVVIGLILNREYQLVDYYNLIKYFDYTKSYLKVINLENYIGYRIKINKYPNRDIQVSQQIVNKLYK